MKSCCAFYAIFHASTWLVMSVLRYLYILHNGWVHKTFSSARTLTIISLVLIYCIYVLTISPVIVLFVMHGWPYVQITNLEPESKQACIRALVASYGWILGVSNIFYFLILHERGAIGKNSVGVLQTEGGVNAIKCVSSYPMVDMFSLQLCSV